MSTVYAGSGDGNVGSGLGHSTWASARANATTSGAVNRTTQTDFTFGIYNIYSAGRGAASYVCVRSYFPFDLSGESGTVTAATISIFGRHNGTQADAENRHHMVVATALNNSTADFGNCFSSGTTLGDNISSQFMGGNQYHDFTIDAGGITAINNQIGSGTFTVALLGHYDFNNTAPSTGNVRTHIQYSESGGAGSGVENPSKDPKITLTFSGASGYTHTIMAVAPGDISAVKGVATSDIDKVNGV